MSILSCIKRTTGIIAVMVMLAQAHAALSASAHSTKGDEMAAALVQQSIDINSADATTLAKVKGIGSKRAKAIVAWRKQHQRFNTLNDLLQVKGMSNKRLMQIRSRLTVK